EPGRRVRGYADAILLGDAVTTAEGRFLIETERELPVGEYIIRVDALDANSGKVIARAAVPFEREAGEFIAAVAPLLPGRPAAEPAAADQAPATKSPAKPPLAETTVEPSVAASEPVAPVEAPSSAEADAPAGPA